MGVPVLTLLGRSFASRVGESLLRTIGLDHWIASDPDEYVAKAAAFAAGLEHLATLRQSLGDRFAASPLGDAPRFARSFETALRGIWRGHCQLHRAAPIG